MPCLLLATAIIVSVKHCTTALVSESNETLSAFQLKVKAAVVKEHEWIDPRWRGTLKKFSRWVFRRPLLLIQLWFFMALEDGMVFDFNQSVLDLLTGIVMINVNARVHLL